MQKLISKKDFKFYTMLESEVIEMIENKIGYKFKDKGLLSQAFIRSSYAEEKRMQGDNVISNEQLEFYGDSVLNYVITKQLSNECDIYNQERKPEELTNFRSNWTDELMLSTKMKKLDLSEFLLVSEGDKNKEIYKNEKIMENLFEALIGAIWYDLGKDLNEIEKIVLRLLNFSFDDKYFKKKADAVLNELKQKINLRWNLDIKDDKCVGILSINEEPFEIKIEIKESYTKLAKVKAAEEALEYIKKYREKLNIALCDLEYYKV